MLLRPTFTFIPPALPSPAELMPIGGEGVILPFTRRGA
jgi:hypothetical protein